MTKLSYLFYDNYFKLKNRDPHNYVVNKDFFFYAIIASNILFLWFIGTIFENYEYLYTHYGDTGKAVTILNDIIIGLIALLIVFYLINKGSNHIYQLLGIIFLLFLINLGIIIFNFDRNEIDPRYERDPVYIGYTFLIIYAFVSYYIC